MACCAESARDLRFGLCDASFQVIDLATRIAMKVMVMLFACKLVAGWLSGNIDRGEPAFLDQYLDVPINSRNSNCLMKLKGTFERFFRRQRPV